MPAGKLQVNTLDVRGAMSDAAVLAFQLPEAPKDVDGDLDEVSQAWLRVRRASEGLLHTPCSPPKLPAKPWIPEGRPPSMKELQILEDVHTFFSKAELSLEDVYDRLSKRTGCLCLSAFRDVLGLLGTKENTYIEQAGTLWPTNLPPAETVYQAMCALLRLNNEADTVIPKDKFMLFRKWLDSEAQTNKILNVHEVDHTLCAEEPVARLQAVMNIVAHHPDKIKSREDVLELVWMMLDLEPRATVSYLLSKSGGETNCAILLDMVLRQGISCIEDNSLLSLMSLCEKLLDRLIQLGRPRCPIKFKGLLRGKPSSGSLTKLQTMAEIPNERKEPLCHARIRNLSHRRDSCSMVRTKFMGDFWTENGGDSAWGTKSLVQSRPGTSTQSPRAKSELLLLDLVNSSRPATTTSMPVSGKSPKLPSLTSSSVSSDGDLVDKNYFYLGRTAPSDDMGSKTAGTKSAGSCKLSRPEDDAPCKDDKPLEKKNLSRNFSTPVFPRKGMGSRTQSFAALPDITDSAAPKQSPASASPLSPLSPLNPWRPAYVKSSDKKPESKNFERRPSRTRAIGRRRGVEEDLVSLVAATTATTAADAAAAAAAAAATAKSSSHMGDAEWEFISCLLFWSTMTPQTITYAIGASLHSVGNHELRSKVIRAAWSLLDKARAIDCSFGTVGTKRLRLEMDTLLDQSNYTRHISKGPDTEEQAAFLEKTRLTMLNLRSMCEAESKLAQVAVLYGTTLIADDICTWAVQTGGGAKLVSAICGLCHALSPHFQQLFQQRFDSEASLS